MRGMQKRGRKAVGKSLTFLHQNGSSERRFRRKRERGKRREKHNGSPAQRRTPLGKRARLGESGIVKGGANRQR